MITISSGLILDRYGKLNFRKCFLSVVLLNVLLFCYITNNLAASGVAFVISRKRNHLNVSSTCETTVSSAMDCIQTSLNDSDHRKSINLGTSVIAKDQYQKNKEMHGGFNNSNLADSLFDYTERAEKGNERFFLASKKQLSQGIQDDVTFADRSWVNDFGKRGPSYGFEKIHTEVVSMRNISDSKNHHQILEGNGILRFFSQETNQDEKSPMESDTYVGCALSFLGILVLNSAVQLLLLAKSDHSKIMVQSLTGLSSSGKIITGLVLLLFQAPVGSDYTMSYSTGTYFRNEAEGRALHGYVNQSFPISTMFECQLKCSILHPTCKSINYIENEDGSNVCEINNEAKYCALPGDFIVKENSFYVEVVPRHDEYWCSKCGHRGVIVETKDVPGYKCLCRKEFYGDKCQNEKNPSIILRGKPNFFQQIKQWLPDLRTWHSCYQASRNGWRGSDFHSRCDDKGATVTIIRVGEYIFGGYTDVSCGGSSGYKSSTKSFIFSLRNKDNLPPFKAPVFRYSSAIYCSSGSGPTFGGGHDINIADNAHSNTGSSTNFGFTYRPPSGYSYYSINTRALLAGSYYFTVSEVEVFYLR